MEYRREWQRKSEMCAGEALPSRAGWRACARGARATRALASTSRKSLDPLTKKRLLRKFTEKFMHYIRSETILETV